MDKHVERRERKGSNRFEFTTLDDYFNYDGKTSFLENEKIKKPNYFFQKLLGLGDYVAIAGTVLLGFYICGDDSLELKEYFPDKSAALTGLLFVLYSAKRMFSKEK